jgi:putative membrane protein
MRRHRLASVAAGVVAMATAATGVAVADSDSGSQLSRRDRSFLKDAARGAYYEIAAGKLAATKGATPEVRALGAMLEADHTAALNGVMALASKYSVRLPDEVSDNQEDVLEKLERRDGLRFDRTFVKAQVEDHREDIADFRAEARKGRNDEVQAFAAAAVPRLRQHLAAVRAAKDVVQDILDASRIESDAERRDSSHHG